jgi:hypothetical protein
MSNASQSPITLYGEEKKEKKVPPTFKTSPNHNPDPDSTLDDLCSPPPTPKYTARAYHALAIPLAIPAQTLPEMTPEECMVLNTKEEAKLVKEDAKLMSQELAYEKDKDAKEKDERQRAWELACAAVEAGEVVAGTPVGTFGPFGSGAVEAIADMIADS